MLYHPAAQFSECFFTPDPPEDRGAPGGSLSCVDVDWLAIVSGAASRSHIGRASPAGLWARQPRCSRQAFWARLLQLLHAELLADLIKGAWAGPAFPRACITAVPPSLRSVTICSSPLLSLYQTPTLSKQRTRWDLPTQSSSDALGCDGGGAHNWGALTTEGLLCASAACGSAAVAADRACALWRSTILNASDRHPRVPVLRRSEHR